MSDVPAPGPPARILVIDDEPLVGKAIRRILAAYQVTVLTDPRQALARLRSGERFELVFCDLMMPEMSGMELHAEIRALAPELAGRMVFITGGAFTPWSQEFLGQPGRHHVEKPFTPETLRAKVRALLAAPA